MTAVPAGANGTAAGELLGPADFALFGSLVLVLGTSYPFTKIGLEVYDPLTMVLIRLVIGAVFLTGWMAWFRIPLPTVRGDLERLLALGLVNTAGAFLLLTWGQQYLPASFAAILVGTGPIFAALGAAIALPDESVDARRGAGVLIGFAGIVVLFSGGFGTDDAGHHSALAGLAGAGAILCATALIAVVAITVRRGFRHLSPAQIALPQLATGITSVSLLLLVLVPAGFVSVRMDPWAPAAGAAVLSLGLLNAGIGNLLYYASIARFGVTGTALVGYVAPVVGVALTVLLLHHWPGVNELGGLTLVVASMALVGRRAVEPHPDAIS